MLALLAQLCCIVTKCVNADQLEARSLQVHVCTFVRVVLALPCTGTIFSHSL